jgi:hypothetical protein
MTTRTFVGPEKTGRDGNDLVIGTSDIGRFVAKVPKRRAAKFPLNDKTSHNRQSM